MNFTTPEGVHVQVPTGSGARESAQQAYTVPTGRNKRSIEVSDAFYQAAQPYFSAHVADLVESIQDIAGKHVNAPGLKEATARLAYFVNGTPERMQVEIAKLPEHAKLPDDLPPMDTGRLNGLIQDVRDLAGTPKDDWRDDPDHGPRQHLFQRLSWLRNALSVGTIDAKVYDPALRALGFRDQPEGS